MSGLFSKPKTPDVTMPALPPEETTVQEEETKKLARQGRNYKGTITTSPQGILEAPAVNKKSLLGD